MLLWNLLETLHCNKITLTAFYLAVQSLAEQGLGSFHPLCRLDGESLVLQRESHLYKLIFLPHLREC